MHSSKSNPDLQEYQRRRLELADMLRAVIHIARSYGDDEVETQDRRLLSRLAQDTFELAVVGQFSRGKSTLMNAILGGDYLPTGALPMTSVITTVRYGSRPRAFIRRRDSGFPIEQPLNAVAQFVAQSSTQRAELQVVSVDIEIPAEILRLGFTFVDTPGIGSTIQVNTATTRRLVPQADAIIFVTGFDSALTAVEAEFLAQVGRHASKLFFVINKRDLVTTESASEIVQFVKHRLADELQLAERGVFDLSALEALEGRLTGDDRRLADSGLMPFEGALTGFLTTEKAELFLRNLSDRATRLVARQRRDLRLGMLDNGDEITTAFQTRTDTLRAEMRARAEQIAARIDTELPQLLAAREAVWHTDLRQRLTEQITGPVEQFLVDGDRGGLDEVLGKAGRQAADSWVRVRAADVYEMVLGVAVDDVGALLADSRLPGAIGAEIAGLALPEDHTDLAGWSPEDVPAQTAPIITWSAPLDLPGWGRRKSPDDLRRRIDDSIDRAAADFGRRAGAEFVRHAASWAERLRDQALRAADKAATRFVHNLAILPHDEDLDTLDGLHQRLIAFSKSLPELRNTAHTGAHDPVAATPRDKNCVVCAQLEETLFDFLRHDQYRLATREQYQRAHAEIGGFCQLHTWEYAAMASPIGISAGYARLADSLGDTIESLTQSARTTSDLSHAVAEIVTKSDRCPVCAALRQAESTAVTDEAKIASTERTLCLRHISLVLSAAPPFDRARQMLTGLAARLRRESEDMRAYTLKREALHSGLVTGEESQAYDDTLHLLAGQPSLVRPWFQE
jgi:ribosome biogenesis GTPase A